MKDRPIIFSAPIRIQRKRTKGWRMPADTIYVGRPSAHGNPFHVGQDGTQGRCVDLFRQWLTGTLSDQEIRARFPQPSADWLINMREPRIKSIETLRGKSLCCWCHPNDRCHADVLLELANK